MDVNWLGLSITIFQIWELSHKSIATSNHKRSVPTTFTCYTMTKPQNQTASVFSITHFYLFSQIQNKSNICSFVTDTHISLQTLAPQCTRGLSICKFGIVLKAVNVTLSQHYWDSYLRLVTNTFLVNTKNNCSNSVGKKS